MSIEVTVTDRDRAAAKPLLIELSEMAYDEPNSEGYTTCFLSDAEDLLVLALAQARREGTESAWRDRGLADDVIADSYKKRVAAEEALRVARAMGWRLTETRSLNGEPMFDNGRHLQEFDLFAISAAGALAREEAEEWLLKQGYEILPRCNEVDGRICCLLDHDDFDTYERYFGATLAEARATAICNAVRGMREDKNG